jgi:hypothetical protein
MMTGFVNSPEGQLIFKTMSDTQFVDTLYSSFLGRQADAGWVNHMHATGESRGALAGEFLNCVQQVNNSDTTALINRGDVSFFGGIISNDDGTHSLAGHAALIGVTTDINTVEQAQFGLHKAMYGF